MTIPDEAKEWVLDALEDLVSRCGPERFVAAPILEPTEDFFPDVLAPGPLGIRTLVRRVMAHGGLEQMAVDLTVIPDGSNLDPASPIMLAKVQGHAAQFDLFEERPRSELLGFLCFEVAHTYRAVRKLDEDGSPYRGSTAEDPSVVDRLAAVTAVFMGFGVLAANAAHMYSAEGQLEANWMYTYWEHKFAGGLPPDVVAWALGVQSVVRERAGGDEQTGEVKQILRFLRPNQAASFKRARRELLPHRAVVLERLGLPDEEQWPDRAALIIEPLQGEVEDEKLVERLEDRADEKAAAAADRVVYRVTDQPGKGYSALIAVLAGVVGLSAGTLLSESTALGAIVGLVAAAVALLVLRRKRRYCSDGDCQEKLPLELTECPGCGARVAGDVDSRADALDLPRYRARVELDGEESADDSWALAEAHARAEAKISVDD